MPDLDGLNFFEFFMSLPDPKDEMRNMSQLFQAEIFVQ